MDSNKSSTRPKDASLLGLPRELRLHVYSLVCDLDLRHTILKQWRDTHSAVQGFKSVPDLCHDARLIIPWLSLMLTCKAIAIELRAFMTGVGFLADEAKHTYVVDLEATRGGMTLGTTTWRRLPCPPDKALYLEACYNASCGFQAWGVGGPHGITSGLYQTLNHLIHCGPRFDSERPLDRPMHLEELRIVIESRGTTERGNEHAQFRLSERDTDPETTLYALGSIVGQIVRTGALRSFVDRISLSTDDKILQWVPKEVEADGIPEYWHRYGFEWGMGLYHKSSSLSDGGGTRFKE